MLGGRMLVFGGRGSQLVFNDVWSFAPSNTGAAGAVWSKVSTTNAPPVRTGHAAAAVGTGLMVIVGGSGVLGRDSCDVWILNTATNAWVKVDTTSSPSQPAGRHGHLLRLVQQDTRASGGATGTLLMYGGQSGTADNDPFLRDVWQLQITLQDSSRCPAALRGSACGATGVWTQGTSGPPPRANMAVASMGGTGDTVVFGGFSGYSGGLNDRLLFDTWQLVTTPGIE